MVGRRKEWEQLLECRALRAVRGGPFLALISGEPGIGKTRLAEELYEWCHTRKARAGARRCYSGQGQLAYAPIAEWLRSGALEAARAQLAQAQLAELARVLPEILDQHPTWAHPRPLNESWERRHFYHSLNAAFAKAEKPLLLLIDDLQWCDADSFEWLHSLFRLRQRRASWWWARCAPKKPDASTPSPACWARCASPGKPWSFRLPLSTPPRPRIGGPGGRRT